jgi:phosphoglycolate phosphatase-like HAD superfamily hydrolase
MKIKNIIWDFDGTIMDTYPAIATATYNVAKKNNIETTYDQILKMTKVTLRYALDFIADKTSKSYSDLFQEYLHEYDNYDIAKLPVFDKVVDILTFIKDQGGKNYIITHRGKASLIKHLQEKKLDNFFSYLITGDCDFPRKPQADAFIFLRDKYQLSNKDTIVVGDRLLDVQAGYGAGFKGILYKNPSDFSGKLKSIDDYKELLDLVQN